MKNLARRLTTCAALSFAIACGGNSAFGDKAFSQNWQNDGGESIAAVYERVQHASMPTGTAIALGITKSELTGLMLNGKGKWKYTGPVDERPVITGDVVVTVGGGQLTALDAKSGQPLWKLPAPKGQLLGAGDDGSLTAMSFTMGAGQGSQILVVDRGGSIVQKMDVEPRVGTPALLGGVLFVPWSAQYVTAIDVESGKEIGRMLVRSQVSHALNIGGSLYLGGRGLLRFDQRASKASEHLGSSVLLPERELPGKPMWLHDGAMAQTELATAKDKIRLYARPASTESGISIEGNRYMATYFRVVLGMSAGDSAVAWAKTTEMDVLGGDAASGGFVICDVGGGVRVLEGKRGGETLKLNIGHDIDACIVQAGDLRIQGGGDTGPLSQQMENAILLEASQMVTMQRFLLRELATREDPEVTKTLIRLASSPRPPPMLRDDASGLLAARRHGAEHMLAALESRYDYLEGVTRIPPVGALADALAAMKEYKAASLLAEHLGDPATPIKDVLRAARALIKLGSSEEYPALQLFFSIHRGTASDEDSVEAVIAAAQAMAKINPALSGPVLKAAAKDSQTVAGVKNGIASLTGG